MSQIDAELPLVPSWHIPWKQNFVGEDTQVLQVILWVLAKKNPTEPTNNARLP